MQCKRCGRALGSGDEIRVDAVSHPYGTESPQLVHTDAAVVCNWRCLILYAYRNIPVIDRTSLDYDIRHQ